MKKTIPQHVIENYIQEADRIAKYYGINTLPSEQTKPFLDAVYARMPAGRVGITCAEKDKRLYTHWRSVGDCGDYGLSDAYKTNNAPSLIMQNLGDVYWNCASRKPHIKSGRVRGESSELLHISSFFADFDCAKQEYAKLEPTVNVILNFLEPTYIVSTGGGLQAIYVLTEAIDVSTKALAELYQQRAKALFEPLYQIDKSLDLGVTDAPRLLRLPGFANRKEDRYGAIARIIYHNPNAIYSPEYIYARVKCAPVSGHKHSEVI